MTTISAQAAAILAANDSGSPQVAALASGNFVAVWSATDGAVQAQVFDASGHTLGAAIQVAAGSTPTGVAGLASGGFVVELQQANGQNVSVTAQRVDVSGQLAGAPATVATYSGESGAPKLVGGTGVFGLPGGGFVAEVVLDGAGLKGFFFEHFLLSARVFDADGNRVAINGTASNVPRFDATVLANGDVVLAANDYVAGESPARPGAFEVFDPALSRVGSGVESSRTAAVFSEAVAALANGNIVLAWQVDPSLPAGQANQLQAQIFGSSFDPTTGSAAAVTPVLTFAGDFGTTPDLTALAGGGFLLSWSGHFAQAFDSSGQAMSDVIQIASQNIAATPDGGFIVVARDGRNVVEQTYSFGGAPAPAPPPNQPTAGDDHLTGTSGNDRLDGLQGNDALDGGAGTDTAVIETSVLRVLSYSIANAVVTLTTDLGTVTLQNMERVQFGDALFALDTNPGGHVWQVMALFHAGFGALPNRTDLSHWTVLADRSGSMGELAQQMLDHYAAGISTHDLVAALYQQIVHTAPSEQIVQSYVDRVGAGREFATPADLFVYAATVSLNTDAIASIVGTVQQLDPGAF